jgi:hypothetical protein
MRKSLLMLFLVAAAASAQKIQNSDIFVGFGPVWTGPSTIGGSSVALTGSTGFSLETSYGYQVERISAIGVLLDLTFAYPNPGTQKANVPGSTAVSTSWDAATLGLRFMVPANSRLSFYGVAGGGIGAFSAPSASTAGTPASVSTRDTTHGVLAFGGGMDLRLSEWFSVRAEVRDYVSGRELSGDGRNHVLPVFGVAFHF